MKNLYIFVDTSGGYLFTVGSYLILQNFDDIGECETISWMNEGKPSSTIDEMITVLHVLNIVEKTYNISDFSNIYLYTDCNNIINLCQKRKYDEKIVNHRNYLFYKELWEKVDKMNISINWTKGHKKEQNTPEEIIFGKVDQFSRKKLRYLTSTLKV